MKYYRGRSWCDRVEDGFGVIEYMGRSWHEIL